LSSATTFPTCDFDVEIAKGSAYAEPLREVVPDRVGSPSEATVKPVERVVMKPSKVKPAGPSHAVAVQPSPEGDVPVSAFHRVQRQEQNIEAQTLPAQTIDDILAGVIITDERHRVSLFLGVEAETRTRAFTYRANAAALLNPEDIQTEGAEWVSVSPSTTMATLVKRFGDRLLFAAGERKEQTLTVLVWELPSRENKSVRVLVRKEED
jgi:hypothetical protein